MLQFSLNWIWIWSMMLIWESVFMRAKGRGLCFALPPRLAIDSLLLLSSCSVEAIEFSWILFTDAPQIFMLKFGARRDYNCVGSSSDWSLCTSSAMTVSFLAWLSSFCSVSIGLILFEFRLSFAYCCLSFASLRILRTLHQKMILRTVK